MLRLFVALSPPPALRDRLAHAQAGLTGVRWVAPENLHLTLRFIGDVDDPLATDIDGVLARLSPPTEFSVQISGFGSFGSRRKVRSLWAGVSPSPPLHRLRDKVDRALVDAGLAPDGRKFRPHITLGRAQGLSQVDLAGWLQSQPPRPLGAFCPPSLVLYRSRLARDGAIYEQLAQYPLSAADSPNFSQGLATHEPRQGADDPHRLAHEEPLEPRQPPHRP